MTLDVQEELHKLWLQSYDLNDGYKFHAVRLDIDAYHLLMGSRVAFMGGELDPTAGSGRGTWRDIPIVLEVPALTATPSRDAKPDDVYDVAEHVKIICIETRQTSQHGRSKYYEWERP